MMRNVFIFLVSLIGIAFITCESKNEEELFGCDTTNVSFAADFMPILESVCYDCHSQESQTAPFLLEGYDNVKNKADDGRLQGALNHRQGFSPMPKFGNKLPECDLAKINAWINDGAPDN